MNESSTVLVNLLTELTSLLGGNASGDVIGPQIAMSERAKNFRTQILRIQELADYLDINSSLAKKLMHRKDFPSFREGNTTYTTCAAVDRWQMLGLDGQPKEVDLDKPLKLARR